MSSHATPTPTVGFTQLQMMVRCLCPISNLMGKFFRCQIGHIQSKIHAVYTRFSVRSGLTTSDKNSRYPLWFQALKPMAKPMVLVCLCVRGHTRGHRTDWSIDKLPRTCTVLIKTQRADARASDRCAARTLAASAIADRRIRVKRVYAVAVVVRANIKRKHAFLVVQPMESVACEHLCTRRNRLSTHDMPSRFARLVYAHDDGHTRFWWVKLALMPQPHHHLPCPGSFFRLRFETPRDQIHHVRG